ncbi:uncharacterized protein [Fopius arisanus]|uniref:Uncharacterized protein n=1 Tax=Fopius arisanus TaxID=64838 RepID=A0A9R1SZR7_9HYME|nr:PREDICTED: uncharacterized protein LOC105264777 [Fopius arisanus]
MNEDSWAKGGKCGSADTTEMLLRHLMYEILMRLLEVPWRWHQGLKGVWTFGRFKAKCSDVAYWIFSLAFLRQLSRGKTPWRRAIAFGDIPRTVGQLPGVSVKTIFPVVTVCSHDREGRRKPGHLFCMKNESYTANRMIRFGISRGTFLKRRVNN